MIPIVLGLYQLAPQNDPVVCKMFRNSSPGIRLQIWHDYATWSLERPLVGHGANHTYVWGQQMNGRQAGAGGPPLEVGPSQVWPHTHNMYLQVWYDLGAVGAVLFAGFGLAILWAIGRMPRQAQIAQLATFAAVAAFIPTSYGLWQPWLLGLFALVAISAVAAGLMVERPGEAGHGLAAEGRCRELGPFGPSCRPVCIRVRRDTAKTPCGLTSSSPSNRSPAPRRYRRRR